MTSLSCRPKRLQHAITETEREHAIVLARPMIGAKMMGEPWIADLGTKDPLFARRACQYATVLLRRRRPEMGNDLGHFFAAFEPPDTVVFRTVAKRLRRRALPNRLVPIGGPAIHDDLIVIASLVLPAHVMAFRPDRAPETIHPNREIRP